MNLLTLINIILVYYCQIKYRQLYTMIFTNLWNKRQIMSKFKITKLLITALIAVFVTMSCFNVKMPSRHLHTVRKRM